MELICPKCSWGKYEYGSFDIKVPAVLQTEVTSKGMERSTSGRRIFYKEHTNCILYYIFEEKDILSVTCCRCGHKGNVKEFTLTPFELP